MNIYQLNQSLLISFCACVVFSLDERECDDGIHCVLTCPVHNKPGVQYRAVHWYKVEKSERLCGLLMRDLPNGKTTQYKGLQRQVELLHNTWNILLPNATCTDGGTYMCHLAARVGEQNQEGQVHLSVTGCQDSPSVDQMKNMYMVFATITLIIALLLFSFSYMCLKTTLWEGNQRPIEKTLFDAHLRPLDTDMLMSIRTLGPDWSNCSKTKDAFSWNL